MAINKVVAPNSVPTNVSDYVAQNAHMMGFMTQVNMQAFVLTDPTTADKPKVALGSYIAHGGSLYKVEGGDETISGSPADGNVYVRVTGNAALSASCISDISGYSYNHAYGTMTSGAYTLLPYEIRKSGSNWVKYRYDFLGTTDQDLRTTDSPKFNTINTGDGDFKVGQNLRTTDAPTFAAVNTGFGANEVFKISSSWSYLPAGDDTFIIPSMVLGEVKFLGISFGKVTANRTIKITLPDDGLFYVIASSYPIYIPVKVGTQGGEEPDILVMTQTPEMGKIHLGLVIRKTS